MAIRFGADGAPQELQGTDLQSLNEANEKLALEEDLRISQKDRIAAKLRASDNIIVKLETIQVGDENEVVAIKQLPYREASRIDAKKYRRKSNGQLEFSTEYAETVGVAWQIHECVMRDENEGKVDGDGKKLKPKWVKMYSLEEIIGTGKEDEKDAESLMGNPEDAASEYVFALTAAVWRVNPTLSPVNQDEAKAALGMK